MEEDKRPEDGESKQKEDEKETASGIGSEDKQGEDRSGGNKNEAEEKATRKVIYSLCYIWGVLFFLPLLMYGSDKNARRHANEGLIILIIALVGNVLFGIFMGVNAGEVFANVFGVLLGLLNLGILILAVIGIVYVIKEREEPLPLIGGITLIK